jgi:16S rRNA (guanine966-N2)-methyltransferase
VHVVRVVAGTAKGRRLRTPSGRDTRPTSDRVREATFNALGSLDAVADANVVDLFAGSGAMGIEALSRGAAHCTFVERDRSAAEVIRANVAATRFEDRATVVVGDAAAWIVAAPTAVDLAIVDPPYAFDGWTGLLAGLRAALVVVESDRPVEVGPDWQIVRTRRYGTTVVVIARPRPA